MGVNAREADRDQLWSMPPSVADWLPEGHLAWFVLHTVRELDLSGFYASYNADGRGGATDDPEGLMHGDYRFASVMYHHGARARLAAIVDWEMGTFGDPKLDLGWANAELARRHDHRRTIHEHVRRHVRHTVLGRAA